jgi:uncharacterized protein (TIGR02444 family)
MPARNPFWDFSLAVWGREAVEPACLELQARHGIDVNILLFCGWAGRRGRALDAADLGSLIEAARPWREAAVLPLRGLRIWLKTQSVTPPGDASGAPDVAAGALRERIKACELEAEAIQQALLVAAIAVPEGAGGPALTAGNMSRYLGALAIAPGADDTAALADVLRGCHPGLPPLEAVWLLSDNALTGFG